MHKLPDHQRLRTVLGAASRWANRFGATHLGTSDVLLALVEIDGPAKEVLTDVGVTLEDLRDAILESLPESRRKLFAPTDEEVLQEVGLDLGTIREGLSEEFGVRLPLGRGLTWTTALSAAFLLADEQAERLGNIVVTPEHLLLALIWQGGSWGRGIVGSFVSGPELRRRLLERMEVPIDVRSRYVEECERSERIAAERAAAARRAVEWIEPSAAEGKVAELLAQGGEAAVSGSQTLDRLVEMAGASGFSVIDAANPAAPAFWVEVNPRLRQVFVATAIPGAGGEIAHVGVTNPGLVPAWVDVPSWPGFPVEAP